MPNIEDDTWLETVDVHEEPCMITECPKVATHEAVVTQPCGHRYLFCIEHADAHEEVQEQNCHEPRSGWRCAIDGQFIGVIVKWRPVRG